MKASSVELGCRTVLFLIFAPDGIIIIIIITIVIVCYINTITGLVVTVKLMTASVQDDE